MAVTNINTGLNQEKGITYTVRTDTSADWGTVSNGTYFYNLEDDLPYYKNNSGDVLKLFVLGSLLSKTFTLESPTASDDITIFRTDVDITVQEVIAVSTGTSPSTTYQLKHSTDRNAAGNDLTTSSTTTSTTTGDVATLSDATIPANSWVWFETTAATGTNVRITIDIRYTID